ncbi:MAG: hypothetical protein NTX91_01435 [candidate division SR1 bacterium]|nr:hypothetical protein [candidate division SR1 bacterium]
MKKIVLVVLLVIIALAGYLVMHRAPSDVKVPADWTNYTDNGIQLKFPKTFGKTVWRAVTRPPVIAEFAAGKDTANIGCPLLNSGMPIYKTNGTVNGINYTLFTGNDIGAGTLYTSLCYVLSSKKSVYVIDFEISSHSGCQNGNCGAYCGTKNEQECKDFDMNRDVIKPIETIISTFKVLP